MTDATNRGYHDLGGLLAGPVDRCERETACWEKRVDAILMLLTDKTRQLMRVDELLPQRHLI